MQHKTNTPLPSFPLSVKMCSATKSEQLFKTIRRMNGNHLLNVILLGMKKKQKEEEITRLDSLPPSLPLRADSRGAGVSGSSASSETDSSAFW